MKTLSLILTLSALDWGTSNVRAESACFEDKPCSFSIKGSSGNSYSFFDDTPHLQGLFSKKSAGDVFKESVQSALVRCQAVPFQSTCPACKQGCCGSDVRSCMFSMKNDDFNGGGSSVVIPDVVYSASNQVTSCAQARKLFQGNDVLQKWSAGILQDYAKRTGCGFDKKGTAKLKPGAYRVRVSELNCQDDRIVSWPRMTGDLMCDSKTSSDNEDLQLRAKVDLRVVHACRDCGGEKAPADPKH